MTGNNLDYGTIVNELNGNPVFKMSLSAKELFHSNVLAWLLESAPDGELAKLFAPKDGTDLYVWRVMREWRNFDLLIIYARKDDFDILHSFLDESDEEDDEEHNTDGKRQIINDFGLKISKEIYESDLEKYQQLTNACRQCRFVVVENKFKSIPYVEQLEKYVKKIKEKNDYFFQVLRYPDLSTKISIENTTFRLLAPKASIDIFMGEKTDSKEIDGQSWLRVNYEQVVKISQNMQNPERPVFTNEFLKHYAGFTGKMLSVADYIYEATAADDVSPFPKQTAISALKPIRIHDFFIKLWFSAVLHRTDTYAPLQERIAAGTHPKSEMNHGIGALYWEKGVAGKEASFGVGVENNRFEVFVKIETGKNEKKIEISDTELQAWIENCIKKVKETVAIGTDDANTDKAYDFLKEKISLTPQGRQTQNDNGSTICSYDASKYTFKYLYIVLPREDKSFTIRKLAVLVNAVLDMMEKHINELRF